MEVVVGTYDPFLIGFDLLQDSDDDKGYRFEPKFVDRDHAGCVKSIAVDSSCSLLASASTDETIRLFSLKEHKELGTLHQHEGSVTCLTFYGNSHMLSASEDRTICVWECKTWRCLKTLKGHKGPITSISVHPSGRLAMSVSKDKHLRTWNLVTGRSAYVTHIKEVATLIRWSPSGDSYALVIGNKVVIYKLATAALSLTLELPKPVLALQFLSESVVVAGGEFDSIHVYDIEKEKCLQTIEGHESRIKDLRVIHGPLPSDTADQVRTLLLSVSSDGDLRAWALNPNNYSEAAQLLARYEMNGRPTCLTVATQRITVKPVQLEVTEDKSSGEGTVENSDRRKASESADEPQKKKPKKKKKRGSKKKTKENDPNVAESPSREETGAESPSREETGATTAQVEDEAMSEEDDS